MLGETKIKFPFLFCPLTTLKAKTLAPPTTPFPFFFLSFSYLNLFVTALSIVDLLSSYYEGWLSQHDR
jgi:hypothetical protein